MAPAKKKTTAALSSRAWRWLRIALLWARKGAALKRHILIVLRIHTTNSLRSSGATRIAYFEREMSFDETPVFHFKMHRPASMRMLFPCINPQTSFNDDDYDYFTAASPFLESAPRQQNEEDDNQPSCTSVISIGSEQDNGKTPMTNEVDVRAEEFIAKFYEQIKLQRQISLLQYNEMLQRGTD